MNDHPPALQKRTVNMTLHYMAVNFFSPDMFYKKATTRPAAAAAISKPPERRPAAAVTSRLPEEVVLVGAPVPEATVVIPAGWVVYGTVTGAVGVEV